MTDGEVIYEQEKLNLWKEKVALSKDIADSKFLSRDWIYHNILQVAEDDAKKEQQKIEQDVQMLGKLDAVQQQASQPQQDQGAPASPEAGAPAEAPPEEAPEEKKLDTVDDVLASLDDTSTEDESELGDEELEEAKMGRPKVGMKFGQDSHPRGRDPLGHKENLGALRVSQQRKPSRKSPLSLENHEVSSLIKQLNAVKTSPKSTSILNEDNILDLEN